MGAWRIDRMNNAEIEAWIETCLEVGITTFDHADLYGDHTCEERFGNALAKHPEWRERIEYASKCGIRLVSEKYPATRIKHYDTSAEHIRASVENSLRRLRVERLDLLLLHRPDPLLDADEVAGVFAELRRAGKVRRFGVSNFTPEQLELLASRVEQPLVAQQIQISPLHIAPFVDGSLDQCQRRRLLPMAWSPMGGGGLFRSEDARAVRLRGALTAVGVELGASIDQVALAWLLRHPARIVPVLGTGKPRRVRAAAAAAKLEMSRQQWFSIFSASTGVEVP